MKKPGEVHEGKRQHDDENVPFHRVGVQTRFSRVGIKDDLHILCCEAAFDQGQILKHDEIEAKCISALAGMGFLDQDLMSNTVNLDNADYNHDYCTCMLSCVHHHKHSCSISVPGII